MLQSYSHCVAIKLLILRETVDIKGNYYNMYINVKKEDFTKPGNDR